ncbi:ABC transporter substrate-binding protein [Cnuibacter physcomitrellae]|uniref:Sugar ABC transporter substrate-binding protein n=1 Tax=Cnuibacter physcomitrellae TaxID=1619308 RepID=A0A1X9LP81_9MICO|nr:extracellular solute-binding protein [Cnuibacter physcomitrellae]ARJ06252.1 sugar ABC transporter substrate-binding protein [Cnuibacter physcomitrellae]MCS5495951.1 extracellular solute-binding protein [Cnuibacter physcomitrellae]GGI37570.1 ABC transporter substrate-binding protein [Cnuibacter physcomitrellae]
MATQRRSRRFTKTLAITAGLAALGLLSACSGGSTGTDSGFGFPSAEQEDGSTITVWVDASREPIAKAFQEENPDVPISIETYDGNSGGSDTFKTKMALFDQSGEGWPDVVFSTQTNDASWAAKETNGNQAFAAALNKGYLDQSFLDGFTDGALDPMTVDGTVYGLRNDLAPVVLWYNKPLLDQFGYDIPKTWEDYEALSTKLAAEHPGYILGTVGDSFVGPYVYYWGAQAPIFQLDGNTFSSNFDDEHSKKMTDLLDTMVANGTLVQDSVFGSDFVTKYSDKIVAMPGPAWYSGALFQNPDSVNAPAGTIGAADPLYWSGEDEVTGNVGGGVWYASSHSKNLAAVKTFLEFVTSSDTAAKLNAGLPAYDSAASTWLDTQAASGFFAGDFKGSVQTAASSVWGGWGFPSFSPETAYASVVIPALASGKTIADVVPAWQEEILNEAQVQGYDTK